MHHTFRTKTLITKGGKLSINGLPFRTGETVEVLIRRGKKASRTKYPLRGKAIVYRDPFKSVAASDWESARRSCWIPIFGFGGYMVTKN